MKFKYEYRPSLMKRRMLCPASAMLEFGKPDISGGIVTTDGTRMHDALAKGVCPDDFNESMQWIYNFCNDFYNNIYKNAMNVRKEHKLQLLADDGDVIMEGTPDVCGEVIVDNDKYLIIVDWKSGFLEVDDVVNNAQFACYAAMAMLTYNFKKAICYLVQPRIRKVDNFTFTNPNAVREYITAIIDRCEAITPDNVNDEDYCSDKEMIHVCQYCRAKAYCKKQQSKALVVMSDMKPMIESYKDMLPNLTEGQLSDIYVDIADKIKVTNGFFDALKDAIKNIGKENNDICGDLLLTKKSGKSIIEDTIGAYQLIKQYMNQEDLMSAIEIKVTPLRDAFVKKQKELKEQNGEKVTKKSLEEQFNELMSSYIKKSDDILTIKINKEI